jgi:hypothetical protein
MHIHTQQALFLTISARLTGFESVELEGTGMTQIYFDTLSSNTAPDVLSLFFKEVASILALEEDSVIDAAIRSRLMPNSSYEGTAKAIILMWYTGQSYIGMVNSASPNPAQISGNSYVQGLMWDVAEAHPPGAKQPGYGSWAEPPIRIRHGVVANARAIGE